MKFRPGPDFSKDIPIIQQWSLDSQKRERTGGRGKDQRLPVCIAILVLTCILLVCIAVVIYVVVGAGKDDDVTNDMGHLKTYRRQLEEKITYWNQNFINVDENSSAPGTMLTMPEKGFIMMSILKEMSLMSNRSFTNLTSSQHHRDMFYDSIKDLCRPTVTCPVDVIISPYRTLDGSCNNLKYPYWGMTGRSQKRLLPPVFEDGIGIPRSSSVDGMSLPSPRLISNRIHSPDSSSRNDTSATVMVMAFGQIFDHDIMFTPQIKASNGDPIQCCTDEAKSTKGPLETCAPIDIPEVDEYFPSNSCMNFSRSAASICDSCSMCQREQLNMQTSFIDASSLYGATKERSDELREFRNGRLRTNTHAPSHAVLLPMDPDSTACTLSDRSQFCFRAGDGRVNVVPNLSASHAMFLRLHNQIAEQLSLINPHWNDELLFQETRKIVIALTQQTVYNEYLPVVLGDEIMTQYGLKIAQSAYNDVYDSTMDPRISSSFGAASFRFGHSSIPNHQSAMDTNYVLNETFPIEKTFNNPNVTFAYSNEVTRWLVHENAVTTDGMFVSGIRNLLFQNKHNNSFDLVSLNIQRGRDHGIAPYNSWRHFCGLPVITQAQFNNGGQPMGNFTANIADLFRNVYRHPDDIDLFSGAIREIRLYNAHVGPTFACLMGKEFRRLKVGDRFYYENPPVRGMPFVGFTEDQLRSIKNVRFSKMVCDTMDVPRIQRDVFRPVNNDLNRLVTCQELPGLDFNLWKNQQS